MPFRVNKLERNVVNILFQPVLPVSCTNTQEERMEKVRKLFLVLGAALCLVIGTRIVPTSAQQIDRTQLPIPDPQYKYPGKVPLDPRDATFPPIKLLRPPHSPPNAAL